MEFKRILNSNKILNLIKTHNFQYYDSLQNKKQIELYLMEKLKWFNQIKRLIRGVLKF